MNAINRKSFTRRLLDGVDLAIDFATLGEYGLEPLSEAARGDADEHCRERPGRTAGWEALARARSRGLCDVRVPERPRATRRRLASH
jgi:hypothetical protein